MLFSGLDVASKKLIVTRFICFFWLVAKVISWKVWLADRLFPIVPPFTFLFVPSYIHLLLFIFSLLALFALLIFPIKRVLQVSVIIIEIFSCSLDQNRWQPWEYQYIFILLALVINYKNNKNAVSAIAFLLASVYFYSGIGKINFAFSLYVRNKIVLSGIFPAGHAISYEWLTYHAGYLLAFIEVVLSIGLVFKRAKKMSAIFLIVMHLLILAILGPFGSNYDTIIWPWNMAMILILYILFLRNVPVSITFTSMKKGWNMIILILLGVLPALNLFGYWDFYLSSSLFSSKVPEMYICIHNFGTGKTLQPFSAAAKNNFMCDSNSVLLNVKTWSFREIRVPVYPEIRIYKSIKEQLLQRYPGMQATFTVYRYINGKKTKLELK